MQCRQVLGKITRDGVFLEQLEREPGKYLPEVGPESLSAEVVKIDLSEPLSAVPAGFVVQSPARIALDFPGVGSELQRSAIELKHGNLRAAQVVAQPGMTDQQD